MRMLAEIVTVGGAVGSLVATVVLAAPSMLLSCAAFGAAFVLVHSHQRRRHRTRSRR